MQIQYDRIHRAQALMKEEGMIGIMIMNHDDYRYFFGDVRVQPRAIIPTSGPPIFICFQGEEPELKKALGEEDIKVFTHVGEQISDVRKTFASLFDDFSQIMKFPEGDQPRVGMQMWFDTPAFLVDLFRSVNQQLELVPSDPVMDPLRMIKDPEEIELMKEAQKIASIGMDKAREMVEPGVTGHDIATEVLYEMMKNGAEGTSTPMHINTGIRSCWIHGKVDDEPIKEGDFVVIDLTPQYHGYCANLARTFVAGEPSQKQQELIDVYKEMLQATKEALKPGVKVSDIDQIGKEICADHGMADYHLNGISHGIGLRFEETPASTIIPAHKKVAYQENMTVTIGHTVLAIPGFGGVRFEDIYLVTSDGCQILHEYPLFY
ncbi:MAG: Xaa-Pro peptidase family protein [Anaerolineales bacterium]